MTRRWLGAVLALALPGVVAAEDDYRHGRVRYVEDGVSLQRAAEPGAEEAAPNVPFLPGDRVWTDDRGRAEFQFPTGAFLRLDTATKLDYVDDAGRRIVLRLWSGGLFAHVDDGIDFEIETPGGVVRTNGRGTYRVDSRSGDVRVSVYEGDASLEAGGDAIRISEGERLIVRDGRVTGYPAAFDRDDADDFTIWADDRQERSRYARQRPRELPEEAAPFYDELYDYGAWASEPAIGYVWYPRVSLGWSPYSSGRWMWTAYGWTWVPVEPWGWGPFHYGRWGHHPARGWYWIPRRGWSPAWVRWAVGGNYVGWCPLGYQGRPVIAYDRHPRGGHAVPRSGRPTWRYARAGELTKWNLTGHGVHIGTDANRYVREIESPRARLTKDLRVVEGGAAPAATPRTVRTKPTIGDTVPELAWDNQTTIRPPMVRRKRDEDENRHDRGASFGEAAGRLRGREPAAKAPETAAEPRPSSAAPAAPRAQAPESGRYGTGERAGGRARARMPEGGSWSRPAGEAGEPRAAAPRAAAPRSAAPRAERRRPRDDGGAPPARAHQAPARREPMTKAAPAAPPRAHAAPRAERPARDEGAKSAPPAEKRSGGARRRE